MSEKLLFCLVLLALAGCASPAYRDPCERCIGPYDPALRSHREALLESLP